MPFSLSAPNLSMIRGILGKQESIYVFDDKLGSSNKEYVVMTRSLRFRELAKYIGLIVDLKIGIKTCRRHFGITTASIPGPK